MAKIVIDTSGTTDTLAAGLGKANSNFTELYDGAQVVAATAKTTPVDADVVGLQDSAASNVLKKVTWANFKATLKTYFDTLYPVVTPRVLHVTSSGNDTTGDGSLAKPFATFWKALDYAADESLTAYSIQLGWGHGYAFAFDAGAGLPTELKEIRGAGETMTTLQLSFTGLHGGEGEGGSSCPNVTTILNDLTIVLSAIGGSGPTGGGSGGDILLRGQFRFTSINSESGQETTGSTMSGSGGTIILIGGTGAASGSVNANGSSPGAINFRRCNIQEVTVSYGTVTAGGCMTNGSIPNSGTDLGGNFAF